MADQAILKLSPQELSQLADWVLDVDEQRWDEQIEQDIAAGKLEFPSSRSSDRIWSRLSIQVGIFDVHSLRNQPLRYIP